MKTLIKRVFGIGNREVLPLSVLIVLGFFMGIFSATYSVAATTLFLNAFDEGSDLPRAFIFSGMIGLLSAYFYSLLQKKIKFEKLILGFSGAIFFLTGAVILGFYFVGSVRSIIFLAFVLITPFVTHLSLMFWGIFGRMFDVGQAKKIIGNVDTGQLIASIIALFSIPVVLTIVGEVQSLIIISFCSILIFVAVVVYIILKKLLKYAQFESSPDKNEERGSIKKIFKNSYILVMALFVMVSMIVVKFVDYSFLNVASAQFEDEKSLAYFLSFFEGAIVVLSFVFQTFFTDKMIENYGLKTSLLVTPVILFIFIALSSLIGITLFDNYGPHSPTFLVYFIFIGLSRMLSLALKDALDGPTFKLYFMPLEKSTRFDAQIKIEGVVTVFAGSVAGAFLFLFERIEWINFLHITFLIIPFIVLWFFTVLKLYEKYRNTLVSTLERIKKKGRKLFSKLFDATESSMKYLQLKDEQEIIAALEITERVNPLLFEKLASRYQKHKSPGVRSFLESKMLPYEINYSEAAKAESKHRQISETLKLALKAKESTAKGDRIYISKEQLASLSRSEHVADRLLVANALKFIADDDNIFLLIELLRDKDLNVKKAALKTATQINRPETWTVIIETLSNESMANYATAAIIRIGEDILANLENQFHKSSGNPDLLSRIIRIYGELKSPGAYDYLFKKLDYPNHAIKKETIRALRNMNSGVAGYKRTLLNATLEHELAKTFWNQMALSEVGTDEFAEDLRKSLENEINENFETLFNLLGILYDQKSVILVKENFENNTNESVTFALELLNIFVDEELKPILFPVIDNLSPADRLARLRENFPRESFNRNEILLEIIFRESGLISSWTKVCALFAFGKSSPREIPDIIRAQLFSDDMPVRNAALWVIKNTDTSVFEAIVERLKKTKQVHKAEQLESEFLLIDSEIERPPVMERILKLKSFDTFHEVPYEILSHLALAGDIRMVESESDLDPQDLSKKAFVVVKGEISLDDGEGKKLTFRTGDLYIDLSSQKVTPPKVVFWKIMEPTELLLLNHDDILKLSTLYEELMDAFALQNKHKENLMTQTQ